MKLTKFILTLLISFSANVFATTEDDLAAQTGGMAFHLNKDDFNKQMKTNPQAFADAVVKQTINSNQMTSTQIPITALTSAGDNFKQFAMQIKPVVTAFDVEVESATTIGTINLFDPAGAVVKPSFVDARAVNGKMHTRLVFQNPPPGIWKIKIENSLPFTITASYTTESNRVIIWQAYNVPAVANGRIEFPVDPTVSNLSIVITAKTKMPVVQLLAPNQQPAPATDTSISATTFKSVDKPLPGVWTILVSSTEEFSVQIVGQSASFIVTQDFQHKVIGHEGLMFVPDHKSLMPGSLRTFALELISNQNAGLRNFKILLVDVNGNIISLIDVPDISRLNNWLDIKNIQVKIPDEDFRVMITGKDSAGFTYQRMGNYLYPVVK